ncbi:MAG: hypothetical protein H0W08_14715 [Acidobacteria bacterium]|nr:hypothetical protein [Acidobacteriota bacterium]
MSGTLRLSDVLGRNVVIEWFEAVALSRAVSERVSEQYAGESVPDLHQIELSADGDIPMSGATETREPVRRLGQLLQAALSQSDPPVQLRLIVAQATAPVPTFGSVQEFSDALGYFERPDRSGVLRRLYARAIATTEARDHAEPTLDMIAPLRAEDPAPGTQTAVTPVSRRRAALMVMAVTALVAAGTAYWQFGIRPRSGQVSAIAIRASDAVGGAVVSGLSTVSESVGLGRLAPADSSAPAPTAAPAVPTQPATAKAPRKVPPPPAPGRGEPPPLLVFDLDGGAMASQPAPRISGDPLAATIPLEDSSSELMIYSAADTSVTAPIGVRPQLPRALPPNLTKEQLGQIELLILPDGTVGSVKLLGPYKGVLEGMLLSAAKSWTFEPASKNGVPVAFRKVVWLVVH